MNLKKIVGWLFFAIGIGLILQLLAQAIVGIFVFSPLAIWIPVCGIILLWQGWTLAHSKTKKPESTIHQLQETDKHKN